MVFRVDGFRKIVFRIIPKKTFALFCSWFRVGIWGRLLGFLEDAATAHMGVSESKGYLILGSLNKDYLGY